MTHHHYIRNTTLILTCMVSLIFYEISATIYTLMARDKTLDRTPYRTDTDAFNYHVCISRCTYDTECNSFAYTPGTPLGTCMFYDVALEMGDQSMTMVTNPGTQFYSGPPPLPKDCAEWYKNKTQTTSGVYEIEILGKHKVRVYCNMEVDGGGWIVFHRRFDGSESFSRNWDEYRDGFGDVSAEHWLGNKWLNLLTTSELYDYYVIGVDHQGEEAQKKMLGVTIQNEQLKYKIEFQGQDPTGPEYGFGRMNGQQFTTKDHDNDDNPSINCASNGGGEGGWWYRSCFLTNFNGKYFQVGETPVNKEGITWQQWKNDYTSLKETWLMIRPRSFTEN